MAMGGSHGGCWWCLGLAFMAVVLVSSSGCQGLSIAYNIGEPKGWVVDPPENYTLWSAKQTFHYGDKLVFNYKQYEDSAMQVTEKNYRICNTTDPIRYMGSGNSVFVLNKTDYTFFFISGVKAHCMKGQKLPVYVAKAHVPPAPAPSPRPKPSPTPGPKPSPTSTPPVAPAPIPEPPSPVAQPPSPQSSARPADLGRTWALLMAAATFLGLGLGL